MRKGRLHEKTIGSSIDDKELKTLQGREEEQAEERSHLMAAEGGERRGDDVGENERIFIQ